MDEPFRVALVVAAGLVAGILNTVAGGGSLVSLPALIFLGLPADVANATNRIAIVAQNVTAASTFRARGVGGLRLGALLGAPAAAGAALGAWLAVELDERTLEAALAVIMLALAIVLAIDPKRWIEGHAERRGRGATLPLAASFFAIGIYGGFIQAGVGVFIVVALVLQGGLDLLEANAAKIVAVLVFTVPALAIFLGNDLVDWTAGAALALGNVVGGWLGARLAVLGGAPWLRRALVAVVLVSALEMLGARDLFGRWLGS